MKIKKVIGFFLIVFCVFQLMGCQEKEPPAPVFAGQYRIDYRFVNIKNNSVGNEWDLCVLCNGVSIRNGEIINGNDHPSITLRAIVVERDTHPDIGECTATLSLEDGNSVTKSIIVREDKGRYQNHIAEWKWQCTATAIYEEPTDDSKKGK